MKRIEDQSTFKNKDERESCFPSFGKEKGARKNQNMGERG
jgi:hypothetical protein